jgi:hypothetical protein
VNWLLDAGVITAAEMAPPTVEIVAGNTDHHTDYHADTATVRIDADHTVYACRANGWAPCPENGEWHELSHHVAERLGIARVDAASCALRVPHGGWRNSSTCDSIAEGFATFLALLGSITIDDGRELGYGTDAYSVFGSMEDNTYLPWALVTVPDFDAGGTRVVGREDFRSHGAALGPCRCHAG